MGNKFFALLSKMRGINRWSLDRNMLSDNLQEHSYLVAIVSHALAMIKNDLFEGQVDENKVVMMALFHDCSEIVTSDVPTPIKYSNPELTKAFKTLEVEASKLIIETAPERWRAVYQSFLLPPESDKEEAVIVKEADRLVAHIKCIEEVRVGNTDFADKLADTRVSLEKMQSPEVNYFMQNFLEAYSHPVKLP